MVYKYFYARNLSVCETTETHLLVRDSTRVRAYKIDDQMDMTDTPRAELVRDWVRAIKQAVDKCDGSDHSWSDLRMARLKEAAEEEGIGVCTLNTCLSVTKLDRPDCVINSVFHARDVPQILMRVLCHNDPA